MTEAIEKPFSPSCERNREPILDILRDTFSDRQRVLEIGSGTGQHAVFLAAAMSHLQWQASERRDYLAGVQRWLDQAALANTPPAIEFDVGQTHWPSTRFDALFTANTLHIMAWAEVERLFSRLPDIMSDDCVLAFYGPFTIDGRYTSESNAAFDRQLNERGTHMGIRDLAAVDALATATGLRRTTLHQMPANNFLAVWQRHAS